MVSTPPTSLQANSTLEQRIHRALTSWYNVTSEASPLAGLAVVRQTQVESGLAARRAANQVLIRALEALEAQTPSDAHLIRRRFVEDRAVFVVARELNMAEATLFKRQRQAIGRLAVVIAEMEQIAKSERIARAEARLPWIDYHRLFGIEATALQLIGLLRASEPPWIVLLHGIGGQGKTTVARYVMELIIHEADTAIEVAWVSAQQSFLRPDGIVRSVNSPALTTDDLILTLAAQLLPADARPVPFSGHTALTALQVLLRDVPHLVVIDNIETLHDVETLLPTLRRLADPSRFLITSRKALPSDHRVFHVSLPELSERDALDLVRFEANVRNLPTVSQATDVDLRPIFETVGGNPLALKLVVGQLFLLPLPAVLSSLRQARGKKASDLYRYVYWQAWDQLDADGQEVLMCMPLFSQTGADLASIESICEVKNGRLADALEQLANMSLINVSGDLWTRRYSIHHLTETFLLNEVIRWQGTTIDWNEEPAFKDAQ